MAPAESTASVESSSLLGVHVEPHGDHHGRGSAGAKPRFFTRSKDWVSSRFSRASYRRVPEGGGPGRPEGERWCPEEDVGRWGRLLFTYVDGLVELGFVKPLQTEDLWDVARWDAADIVCARFQAELAASRDPRRCPQGSVWTAMWATHGLRFLLTGLLKLTDTGLLLLGPLLLERLLHSLQAGGSRWVAMGYAVAMFVVSLADTINNNQYMYHAMRIFLHLRAALIDMLYRKSLRLSLAARGRLGVGHVVNLQSNDAAKLWWLAPFPHVLWAGPLTIGVVMAMLVRLLGWAATLAGLSVAAALIPASGFVGRRLGRIRRKLVTLTDARVRMTREVLSGIRAIKLYAWEEPYQQRILALRDAELRQIRRASMLSAANSVLFLGGPVLVALASFLVFGVLGGSLTAEIAFPALALFNLLRHPLMMLPSQIVSLINALVGLKRVQAFMEAEEAAGPCLGRSVTPGSTAITVRNGTFSWESGGAPMLHDVNMDVRAGQLLMVVGEVGCGKSSLLCALLGEMHSDTAEVLIAGSIAYCAQDPWIQNVSLRDNILVGRPYDEEQYAAVLEACALLPDLATLPAGDATEIGEKGVNLSGGQRHRVALARAVYSGAEVYLLDDPLSAVDAHVGRHLFTSCIFGLLSGYTRILVTHQLQYLPAADEVIVLSGGRITHRGRYDDLVAAGVQFVQFESISSSSPGDASETHLSQSGCGQIEPPSAQPQTSPSFPPLSPPSSSQRSSPTTAPGIRDSASDFLSGSLARPALDGCTASASSRTAGNSVEPADAQLPYTTPPKKFPPLVKPSAKWESEPALESPATVLSPVSPAGSPAESSEGSRGDLQQVLAFADSGFSHVPPAASPARSGLPEQDTKAPWGPIGGSVGDVPDALLYSQDSMNLGSHIRGGDDGCSTARDGTAVHPSGGVVESEEVLLDTVGTGAKRETLLRLSSREMWAAGAGTAIGSPAVLTAVEEADPCESHQQYADKGTGYPPGTHAASETPEEPRSDERERLLEDGAESSLRYGASERRNGMLDEGGKRVENGGTGADGKADDRGVHGEQGSGDRTGKIIVMEDRAVGRVERDMYLAYLGAWGPLFLLPLAVAALVASERGCQVLQNWWLSVWSSATSSHAASPTTSPAASATTSPTDAGSLFSNAPYLTVYVLLGVLSLCLQGGRLVTMVVGSLAAARRLHAQLLEHTLRLPMSFFDSQPLGRLLNRFSRDTEAVDMRVPDALASFITSLVNVLFSLLVVVFVSPLSVVAIVPLGFMYEHVRRRYVATSRELKRLDSISLSPIFSTFNETLQGVVTIRAYKRESAFHRGNQELIDINTRCQWPIPQVNRYLAMRLELLGSTIILVAATTAAVIMPRSAALAGLAITASLNLTGVLNWLVRQSTELEVQMNGVERVRAYLSIPTEAPAVVENHRPPPSWPSTGHIAVQDLVVRYRPDLPPVLHGLSFEVSAGEKIGIAGRTGCGKSTLMMALYRMLEAESGRIFIDSLDIASIGLFDLRSRLALVPQDPVLFRGTVRENLDPFDTAGGDAALWEALERAGLKPAIRDMQGGLDADVEEGGGNLSTGQRQLLCMARALLRRTRILVLDEATSSVDSETDALIQATVREAFASCTVLTVAHRLHTIADSNRILVLNSGRLLEFGSPSDLLKDPSSEFSRLVRETEKARHTMKHLSPASSKPDLTTVLEN